MTQFRKIFSHSRSDITHAFSKAKPAFSGSGIKVLHADDDSTGGAHPECQACPSIRFADAKHLGRAPGVSKGIGKLLVVIPRTSGKACERNRFRRRVKSLFYEEKWYTKPGFWIIIAYQRALALDFDALKSLLQKTFVPSCQETKE